jgi:hypothetical protein
VLAPEAMYDRVPRFLALAAAATTLATGGFSAAPLANYDASAADTAAAGGAQFASFGYASPLRPQAPDPADDRTPVAEVDRKIGTPDLRAVPNPPEETASLSVQKMPAYRVVEARVFIFRDRDLYTRRGLAALAFRDHPGLLIGKPFRLNEAAAYEIFLEDDWRRTKSDYFDMAHAMDQGGDRSEGRMILTEINDEDVWMRGEGSQNSYSPESDRYQTSHPEGGPRIADLAEVPVDIPFVRKTW